MTSGAAPALWIVGTSVSIEDGGYVTRLTERVQHLGLVLNNLSVGDQTSVMGYMRVLGRRDDIKPADVVVWEYSLLDTLLTESLFIADDVHTARQMAWQCILELGAGLIVVLTAPRKYLAKHSACEARIARDAKSLNLPCLDTRDLFFKLGIHDTESHYRDDRHPRTDSPVIAAMVDAILEHALAPSRPSAIALATWTRKSIRARWQWLGAEALVKDTQLSTRMFRNSLLSIDAIPLAPDAGLPIPATRRIVGVGIISTHDSGGIWCGHPGCPPASTRLPVNLTYAFLLRTTGIPCVRHRVSTIASAAQWAYGRGVWADYGQELCSLPGEVAVFGILYEVRSDPRSKFRVLVHSCRQWLRNVVYRRLGPSNTKSTRTAPITFSAFEKQTHS